MATTRKYDNGASGWTEYDDKGNAVAAGTYNAPGTARNPFNAAPGAGGGINSGEGSLWNNATGQKVASGGSSGNLSYNQPTTQSMTQSSYEQKLADLATRTATAAADAKKFALKQAWEGNSQALNAQNATVDNNFNSAKNNLTALQTTRAGEYQGQKDATSQEAAAQLRRTQALNALTGKFNSGYNRSQMSDVGLARQGSLDSITNNQNTFNSGVANQISAADASRVAALNDIAGKLSLGQQQFNDGTLNISNQLTSDIAIGSLKSSLDAQAWSDQQRQLGITNGLNQSQLDLSKTIADNTKAYQDGMLTLQQANDNIRNAVAVEGVTGRIPDILTTSYPSSAVTRNSGKTYALAADKALNPNAELYIPGVTKMKAGDVFLGGTGTGVTDAELNGAQRIYGNSAQNTQQEYNAFNGSKGSVQVSKLPSAAATLYPNATNITKIGNSYSFTRADGYPGWYST